MECTRAGPALQSVVSWGMLVDQQHLLGGDRAEAPKGLPPRRSRRAGREEVIEARPAGYKRRRRRLLGAAAIGLLILAIGGGWSWVQWGIPARQAAIVEEGLATLSARYPDEGKRLRSLGDDDRLRALSRVARSKAFDPPRPDLAEAALRLAMRRGSLQAGLDLGVLYRDGKLGPPDVREALKLFDGVRSQVEPAVRAGDWSAMIVMGRIYADGLGVQPDRQRAVELTLRGAASATPAVKLSVGKDHYYGSGVFAGQENKVEGLRLVGEAADAGDAKAKEFAARKFESEALDLEIGAPKSDSKSKYTGPEASRALDLYVRAAELGSVQSMDAAGDLAWRRGDFKTAEKWLEAAHRAGANESPGVLGLIRFMNSSSTEWNTAQGVDLLRTTFHQRRKFDAEDSNWQLSNAETGEVRATRGMRSTRQEPEKRGRAALAAQAWLFVQKAMGGRAISAVELDEYLEQLDRRSRADLLIESRKLAKVLMASPAGESTAQQSAAPIRPTGTRPAAVGSEAKTSAPLPETAKRSPPPSTVPAEPEQPPQERSGYLRGAPRDTSAGLSTFTIDNTKGSADSTVRLYRDGKLPAAYSFFVKQTETFTGKGIAPGNYVMRYRNLGSATVYEADRTFAIQELKTADGTRFSRDTVTLFPVASGNMKTKQVDESRF